MILFTAYLLLFFCNQASALTMGCISACNPTCDCSSGDIEISSSITSIEDGAFMCYEPSGESWTSCNNRPTVIIPSSVTSIGVFAYNRLTSILIPKSVQRIEDGAFAGNQLTNVFIPSSVYYISAGAGNRAFTGNPPMTVCFERNIHSQWGFDEGTTFLANCAPPTTFPTASPSYFPSAMISNILNVPLQDSTSCMKTSNLSDRLIAEVTSVAINSGRYVIVEGRFQSSNVADVLNSHLLKVRWFVGRSSYRQTIFLNSTEISYPSNPSDMIHFPATFPNFFPESADLSGYLWVKVILTNWPLRKKAICLRWKRKA